MIHFFLIILIFVLSTVFNLSAYELAIGSMFRNEAPYLKEWIEYHKMVGVSHFWLYNDNSTDNWSEVLQPYIDAGLVEVFDWPTPPGTAYFHRQVEAFRDAVQHARGNTTWLALIDIDEFLLPMQNRSVPECLNSYFSHASAIYVNWRNFGTGGVYLPQGEPILFHLTAASKVRHSFNKIGKSIVRPEAVDLVSTWYPHYCGLLPGAHYVNGNRQQLSFDGWILNLDNKHHEKYIRINHYRLRDENFYQNYRLARVNQGLDNKKELLEQHASFSAVQDFSLVQFIKKYHPEMYIIFWKRQRN